MGPSSSDGNRSYCARQPVKVSYEEGRSESQNLAERALVTVVQGAFASDANHLGPSQRHSGWNYVVLKFGRRHTVEAALSLLSGRIVQARGAWSLGWRSSIDRQNQWCQCNWIGRIDSSSVLYRLLRAVLSASPALQPGGFVSPNCCPPICTVLRRNVPADEADLLNGRLVLGTRSEPQNFSNLGSRRARPPTILRIKFKFAHLARELAARGL